MNVAAVYSITNILTRDRYVGSSANVYTRRNDHLSSLRRGRGQNPRLLANWNQYGESAFEFEILEKVKDPSQLWQKEQEWIDRLNPTLNISKKAKGHGRAKWETERRRFIEDGKEAHSYARFLLTAPDGRQICTDNLAQFAKAFGLERSLLQQVARGKIRFHKDWRCERIDRPGRLKSKVPLKRKSLKYKGYLLTSPEGVVVCTTNLKEFCRAEGLTRENMLKVARGLRQTCGGWKCEYIPFDSID